MWVICFEMVGFPGCKLYDCKKHCSHLSSANVLLGSLCTLSDLIFIQNVMSFFDKHV